MASFIYNSCVEDLANNDIDFGANTFKIMLVASGYTPDKNAHSKRSSVTNEASGTGYTAGGKTIACTVTRLNSTNQIQLSFAAVSWENSTITARRAVVYKSRGGADTADELVFQNDFGADIATSNSTFSIGASTITLQN
jgi:predicted DsbA family dithiol-disulfide isomerase